MKYPDLERCELFQIYDIFYEKNANCTLRVDEIKWGLHETCRYPRSYRGFSVCEALANLRQILSDRQLENNEMHPVLGLCHDKISHLQKERAQYHNC